MDKFEFSGDPRSIWIYSYDETGVYVGNSFYFIPPYTGLPANTTHIPCEPAAGKTGVFNGESWNYVDDSRGTQYWNPRGVGFVISTIQESLPDWAILTPPPAPDDGYVLLFVDDEWTQIEDKTGQAYYDRNGNKNLVPNAYFTLPDGYTFMAPPDAKPTFVTQWDGNEWVYVKDLRGQVAYSTETKAALVISELGPLPADYTLLVPGQFDEWDGSAWVKNEESEHAYYVDLAERQKARLLTAATEQISILTYAVNNGIASESETTALPLWETYRVELNRVDTSTAPNITWPEKP
ncbi:phage tail protein [Brenneria goodwinii]|uniref:Phage tail protein n=1 Tax=Brenneria goodwinii TaxID=1109412 RepID=A0AAE8EP95_9GAMM|nr:tail fiber assembly protein [Brenneria goodwinii]ATA26573.1 phage tail protein [Brenneria goodwinii]RLM25371.1 phage tail protein [Brenneria goodwinii]